MRPTQHPSNNAVLEAPAGATVEQCRPLAVTRGQYGDGTPFVSSFWEFSAEERKAIAAGGKVWFICQGRTHPPVQLVVVE